MDLFDFSTNFHRDKILIRQLVVKPRKKFVKEIEKFVVRMGDVERMTVTY